MINFTVGPVQSSEDVLAIGGEQVPYFRTSEFSELMLENERLVKKFAHATDSCRAVFLTCSGSGGMEAAIMNTLTKNDKALVVNGGSFGERFVELLTLHEIPFTEIKIEHGKALKAEHLRPYEGQGYTVCLIILHFYTSTDTQQVMKREPIFPQHFHNNFICWEARGNKAPEMAFKTL